MAPEVRHRNGKPSPRIGVMADAMVADAAGPRPNEASANQIRLFSQEFEASVLTYNDLSFAPFRRRGQYFVVNGRFLTGNRRPRGLYLLNGAFFYPFVKLWERRYDLVLLKGGIATGFLRHANLAKCVLLVGRLPLESDDQEASKFAREYAPKLKFIMAQSERIRQRLIDVGVDAEKIRVIYPWIDLDKFRCTAPPDMEEFRILSASAPMGKRPVHGDMFVERGVPLLLEAYKEFASRSRASLCLVWRGCYQKELAGTISQLGLENQVTVIDGVADMARLYAQSHVTVVPYLNTRLSPDVPLSAVESLSCGRPVVCTDVAEIAEIVEENRCGCTSKPGKEDLVLALEECRKQYSDYQASCRHSAERLFGLNHLRELMAFLKETI